MRVVTVIDAIASGHTLLAMVFLEGSKLSAHASAQHRHHLPQRGQHITGQLFRALA